MKKFNEEQQQVKKVSVEGDGVMNSHLLAEPAQIIHQVSLQGITQQ